jgi:tetratricopeptide (TPR) repeat protein
MTLTIDLGNDLVTLADRRGIVWHPRTGQWVEFYAALAAARLTGEKGGWVTSRALGELRGWRGKRFASVGKVVARHIQVMASRHGLRVVGSRGLTSAWRLTLREADIVVLPAPGSLAPWLAARRDGERRRTVAATWLAEATRSLLALHLGRVDEAREHARRAFDASGADDRAIRIAAFLLARAAGTRSELVLERDRIERTVARRLGLDARTERDFWGDDDIGRHMRMRLAALVAIETDPEFTGAQVRHLRTRQGPASTGGDLVGLAVLHNVIGLLHVREKRHAEAEFHLAEAIALALTVSDLFTLGGALFNLGRNFMLQARDGREGAGEKAETLLRLSVEMDGALGIGRNSAQAELLLARLLISKPDLAAAEPVIEQAAAMVAKTGSHYDAGGLLTTRAMLVCARVILGEVEPSRGRRAAARLLDEASARFAASGRMVTPDVDGMIEHVRRTMRGRRPDVWRRTTMAAEDDTHEITDRWRTL